MKYEKKNYTGEAIYIRSELKFLAAEIFQVIRNIKIINLTNL